ncbi:MAG: hypothetical protein LR000_00835, partial [Candidatus Pacebacteria bacterium]|nr:hypothetical protein [Candidatus Paceibacterota bacterium]
GNVGIGTATPGYKLDVVGTIRVRDVFGAGGRNLIIGDDVFLTDIDTANTFGIYGLQDSTQAHIKLGSAGPVISGVSGNLGIGETNPTHKLQIKGDVGIKKGYYSRLNIVSDDYWAGIEIRTQNAQEGHPHIDFTNSHSGNYGVRIYAPNDDKLVISGGILEVDKITVNTVDPVYKINNKKYVTYLLDMIGLKAEVVGEGEAKDGKFEVDLAREPEGSDLWLFYNIVKEDTIIPFVSSQSDADLYAYMEGSKFIVKIREGNKNAKFSYRLIGTRKDYKDTDHLLKDSDVTNYIDIDALDGQ